MVDLPERLEPKTQRRPRVRKSIAGVLTSSDAGPSFDQENMTISGLFAPKSENDPKKRSRSKSMGATDFAALKDDAGNKRKLAVLPKSILKPSIPLSPLREIPSRKTPSTRKSSSSPSKYAPAVQSFQSSASAARDTTASPWKIDDALPKLAQSERPGENGEGRATMETAVEDLPELSAEQDQEQEARRKQRENIQKQREARRKSMASRRVSFAPEATLHTWDTVEEMHDSTTSSASTNSTRRASAFLGSAALEPDNAAPSTPPEDMEVDVVKESPSPKRDSHLKKRRRSSGIPPLNFNNPDEALSSSPYSASSSPGPADSSGNKSESELSSGSISEDGDEENDGASDEVEASPRSADLNTNLTKAAKQAEKRIANLDSDGDLSMEIAGDEVTAAFQPWVRKKSFGIPSTSRSSVADGQEIANPFSPAFGKEVGAEHVGHVSDGGDDMSMDITRPMGGILPMSGQRLRTGSRPQSVRDRRRSSGGNSSLSEATMDFTNVVGGIRLQDSNDVDSSDIGSHEDLSMDFTAVLGGIQSKDNLKSIPTSSRIEDDPAAKQLLAEERRASREFDGEAAATEPTAAFLGILQPNAAAAADESRNDLVIETQRGLGGILAETTPTQPAERYPAMSPGRASASMSRPSPASRLRQPVSTSAAGSPSRPATMPAWNSGFAARSPGTPKSVPTTPSKQVTPHIVQPTTLGKTPPSRNVTLRAPSPKKLFAKELARASASPEKPAQSLFQRDPKDGSHLPSILLAPSSQARRRLSGIGLDKEGLGSPRVAALLDRRTSIGDKAGMFAPQSIDTRGVQFDDPRALELQIVKEREDDARRESGRFIMEQESNAENDLEEDVTTTLKDAISSMTPKRNKVKGRKSIAIGTAKGLLGKRPAELDDEDEYGTPQTFKGREASPVKRIRLQAPPSKSETTGRVPRVATVLQQISGNDRPFTPTLSSTPIATLSTPQDQGRFKDAKDAKSLPSAQKPIPEVGSVSLESVVAAEEQQDRIRLQDFLNMTNIRFMELTTTKRRHTIAPSQQLSNDNEAPEHIQDAEKAFADAIVAGACTVPMLELYQHSCRELKKYISEGRDIVREIEVDTFEENPPLFREYLSASPAERSVMDNQFKDMKTHARLLSKAMWYEWRMKLLESLKEGLSSVSTGMVEDDEVLSKRESLLAALLPSIVDEHDKLEQRRNELEANEAELADCDQEELADARQQLYDVEQEIEAARADLGQSQQTLQDAAATIEHAQDAKSACVQAIREADRVRDECRGWSIAEVNTIRDTVAALEASTNWQITDATPGGVLTMAYRNTFSLTFRPSAYLPLATGPSPHGSPISLAHVSGPATTLPTTTRFFLQLMQAHTQALPPHTTPARALLAFVESGAAAAAAAARQLRRLDLLGAAGARATILSDARLAIDARLLDRDARAKVALRFVLTARVVGGGVDVGVVPTADVVYVAPAKANRTAGALEEWARETKRNGAAGLAWADGLKALEGRLHGVTKTPGRVRRM